MEAHKSGTPYFLCQSLLLSTTVLNDNLQKYLPINTIITYQLIQVNAFTNTLLHQYFPMYSTLVLLFCNCIGTSDLLDCDVNTSL